MSVIPARIIHNWDFTPRKVSRNAMQYLKAMQTQPVLLLDKQNPMIARYVEEYTDLRALRERLVLMQSYIGTCRYATNVKLPKELKSRQYLLENEELSALQDLVELNAGTLIPVLKRVHGLFSQHIVHDCDVCKNKGFYCEICDTKTVIYAFQEGMISCTKCASLFHRGCFTDSTACPKCARIEKYRSAKKTLSESE